MCKNCSNYQTMEFLGKKLTGCACGMNPNRCTLNKDKEMSLENNNKGTV